uniref:Pleiotrophin n=1 Tax=Eptatretus burgeri TaxID=7764 RepID=A0A8C4N6K8_EPTBU
MSAFPSSHLTLTVFPSPTSHRFPSLLSLFFPSTSSLFPLALSLSPTLSLSLLPSFSLPPTPFREKKGQKQRSDCEPWVWGLCIPTEGDCGPGSREGTRGGEKCKTTRRNVRCKIPCNWKKTFGADCKYRFQPWGPCNDATHLRSRTGTLKQALFNAQCHETVTATRECGKGRQPKRNGIGKGSSIMECTRSIS